MFARGRIGARSTGDLMSKHRDPIQEKQQSDCLATLKAEIARRQGKKS